MSGYECLPRSMNQNLPRGYTCDCGKFNKYSLYVFAHWTIELVHTCECGKKWRILRGKANLERLR